MTKHDNILLEILDMYTYVAHTTSNLTIQQTSSFKKREETKLLYFVKCIFVICVSYVYFFCLHVCLRVCVVCGGGEREGVDCVCVVVVGVVVVVVVVVVDAFMYLGRFYCVLSNSTHITFQQIITNIPSCCGWLIPDFVQTVMRKNFHHGGCQTQTRLGRHTQTPTQRSWSYWVFLQPQVSMV